MENWLWLLTCIFSIATPNSDAQPAPGSYEEGKWSYANQDSWTIDCKGYSQSPINIIDSQTTKTQRSPFVFSEEFRTYHQAIMTNHDYTIAVNISAKATVSGGGLRNEHVFLFFNFHWPSDHMINNRRYPLEVRFVFFNTFYGLPQEAVKYANGLLMFSSFYTVSPGGHSSFDNILESLPMIASKTEQPASTTLRNPVLLSDFLPPDLSHYYYYQGSVTKPNCDQNTIYYVFPKPSNISQYQLNALTNILDKRGNLVVRNSRDVQPLHERPVYSAS